MPSQVAAALEYGSAAQRDHLSDRFPASWDRGGSISDQELLNVHSPKESSTKRTARARFRVGSSTTLFESIDSSDVSLRFWRQLGPLLRYLPVKGAADDKSFDIPSEA